MHSRASSLPPLGSQSSLAFLRSASTNLRAPLPCSSSRIGSAVNVKSSPTGPTGKFISRRNSGASPVAVARGQPSPDRSFCLTDCPRKALRNDIIAETKRPVEGACAIYPQVSHSFSTPARRWPLCTIALVEFLIDRTKLPDRVKGQLNALQENALLLMFREGLEGFRGGFRRENTARSPEPREFRAPAV